MKMTFFDFYKEEGMKLRYGENPQQAGDVEFGDADPRDPLAIGSFIRDGIELRNQDTSGMSLILFSDFDRSLETLTRICAALEYNRAVHTHAAVIVKHGSACGAAFGEHPKDVFGRAYSGSKRDAFGGFAMANFAVDAEIIDSVTPRPAFDTFVAQKIAEDARAKLVRKSKAVHFFENAALQHIGLWSRNAQPTERTIRGGKLRSSPMRYVPNFFDGSITIHGGSPRILDLALAWAVGSSSVSNTITLVKDGMVIANGVGQQSRVGCCALALETARVAGHDTRGSVAYSDSFFPFEDGVQELKKGGVEQIFTCSGSVNDRLVIEEARKLGITMCLIPVAVGRGFYGHI